MTQYAPGISGKAILGILIGCDHFGDGCTAYGQGFRCAQTLETVIKRVCVFCIFRCGNGKTVTFIHDHSGNGIGILNGEEDLSLGLGTGIQLEIHIGQIRQQILQKLNVVKIVRSGSIQIDQHGKTDTGIAALGNIDTGIVFQLCQRQLVVMVQRQDIRCQHNVQGFDLAQYRMTHFFQELGKGELRVIGGFCGNFGTGGGFQIHDVIEFRLKIVKNGIFQIPVPVHLIFGV